MDSESARSGRLDSWKAIARYLGRSVRTVRRWEAAEGLPVHRHMHQSLASVYAFKSELDAWQREARRPAQVPVSERTSSVQNEAAMSASPSHAIVVLPFALLSPTADDQYLADGFTEEVISHLSALHELRVISRTSSMALKGTKDSAQSIGELLRVDHLVEGSVRVQGERMRVAVRLIATQADQQRWSDSFDASLEEVFAIQERIARHIVSALELHLTQEEDRHLRRQPAQGNLQAWQLAMAARQQSLRWRPDAIDQAIDLLGRAIELAGDEPMLHAALGRTWLHYREAGIDLSERPLTEAQYQAERLLAIDANDPGTRQLAGWIHYSRGEVQQAVRELQRAVQVNQSDPDTLGLLSNCYLISGRVTRARPLIERLLAIDPLTPLTQCLPGWADALDGDFRAALPAYRRMFEMDPGNPIGRLFYVWILASLGDTEELLQRVEEFPAPLADSLPAQIARMFARAVRGEALPSGEALPDHHEALAMSNDMFPRLLGQAYALAGNGTEAVRWLSVAVDRGFIHYPFLAESDPTLKGIAGDRDFVRLLETARERWSAFED